MPYVRVRADGVLEELTPHMPFEQNGIVHPGPAHLEACGWKRKDFKEIGVFEVVDVTPVGNPNAGPDDLDGWSFNLDTTTGLVRRAYKLKGALNATGG